MKKTKKKAKTSEVYTMNIAESDVFLKKVNSYRDEEGEPIADVDIIDHEILEDGVEVDIYVNFGDNEKAKENLDDWFENEFDETLEFADLEEVTEDWDE
jgi:hypothetical protein